MKTIHLVVLGFAFPMFACGSSTPTGLQGSEAGAGTFLWPEPPPPSHGSSGTTGENPWLDGFSVGSGAASGGNDGPAAGGGSTGSGGRAGAGEATDPAKKGTEVATGGEGTFREPEPELLRPELLIMRYEESTGSDKRLEIRNLGRALEAGECSLMIYSNGNGKPYRTIEIDALPESASVRLCTTHVIDAKCSMSLGATSFNGNDAIVLACGPEVVDSFGRVGEDPGRGWSEGALCTWDASLVRCGDTRDIDPSDAFTLSPSWISGAFDLDAAEIADLCPLDEKGPGGAGPV